ncbi:hypothetical protein BFW86_12615 [Pseudomonas fluorescens]|nr:hypothetical protein BFW86_12615 [Pseudomonas fluorescens]
MPATAQQLTLAQQRKVLPKKRRAIGQFDVKINHGIEIYQTKTLRHDNHYSVYNIEGRHADSGDTIKRISIQVPDTIRPGIYQLDKQGDTGAQVWYSTIAASGDFILQCITGTLVIDSISGGSLAIRGNLSADTELNQQGEKFFIQIDFNLQS